MIKNIEKLKLERKKEFDFLEKLDDIQIEDGVVSEVDVDYRIELVEGEVLVRGGYKGDVTVECVRCLTPVKIELEGEFYGHYIGTKAYKEYLEGFGKESQVDGEMIEELVDDQVDISKLVREFMILDMPQFPQCEPSCDGLEEAKNYTNDGVDPRWAGLLNLKN